MKLQQLIETKALAHKLLNDYGLVEQGWTFEFSNRKTAIGTCNHTDKTIQVSKHYIESHPDEIRDTILHEIAHALVGTDHGHDNVWRMKAVEVGANPSRATDNATFSGTHNYTVGCDNEDCSHNWESYRHRLKNGLFRYHCKWCGGPMFVLNNKTGEVTYTEPAKDWAVS